MTSETKFNLFRVYEENHPENLTIKPPKRESEPEIDFSTKPVLNMYAPGPTVSKPNSALPMLTDLPAIEDADRQIWQVNDVNEALQRGDYPAAEYLLGRKLTPEEIAEKQVHDLLKPKEKLEDTLRKEITREALKARIKAEMEAKEDDDNTVRWKAAQKQLLRDAAAHGSFGVPIPAPPVGIAPRGIAAINPADAHLNLMEARIPLPKSPRQVRPPNVQIPTHLDSPIVSAQNSPTGSIASTALAPTVVGVRLGLGPATPVFTPGAPLVPSQQSGALLRQISSLPGGGGAVEFYNTMRAAGVDDDDFKDLMNEDPDDFSHRMEALGHDAEDIAAMETIRAGLRAAMVRAQPAAAAVADKKSSLDFSFTDVDGQTYVFDPTLPVKQQPTVKILAMIRNQMVDLYPSFREKHFKGLMQAEPKKPNLLAALKAANAEIVQMKLAGPSAAPIGGHDEKSDDDDDKGKGKGQVAKGLSLRKKRASSYDWVPFGSTYQIDRNQLKQGKFAITYQKSGHKAPWTNNAVLSKELQAVLQAYLAGEPMNTRDLSDEEQAWVKHVWRYAKLTREKPTALVIRKPESGQDAKKRAMKTRLKVLIGEQDAGNDNPEVTKEIRQLARDLLFRGWITKEQMAQVEALQ